MIQTEGQLKRAASDYLQYGESQGKWLWLRLNAGQFPTQSGRWARGCRKGTADLLVLVGFYGSGMATGHCRTIFLETKSIRGKQTKEQKEFQVKAEVQGCEYYVIRSIEELQEAIDD